MSESKPSSAKVIEFLAAEARDRAGRTVEGSNGLFAVIDDRWPRSYDNNKVVVAEPVEPEALLAFADAALGGAGAAHRQILVLVDGQVAAGPAREAGYDVSRTLLMALPNGVDAATPDPAIDVRVVDEATVRPVIELTWHATSPEFEPETVRQLVSRRDGFATAGAVTPFVAYENGNPVAHADLRIRGTVGEVDSVVTLPDHRNRGYARALVLSAAARALDAGIDLVFLQADADEWPHELYGRLGFEVVGEVHELYRPAP